MSNVDPGGGSGGDDSERSIYGQPATNLSSLQESFSQQQTKISALKELVRQSEADQGRSTANAKEKVKNIAQRLNHLKSKTSRGRHSEKSFSEIEEEIVVQSHAIHAKHLENDDYDDNRTQLPPTSTVSVPTTPLPSRARSETPGSEKIQLLRQQMEQNRLKMAERESSNRGIEQLVTQLKAKFDSSQLSLEKAHQLGRSVGDLSNLPGAGNMPSKHQSTGDLSGGFNLERERIKYLEKRVRHLETDVKAKEREFFNKDPESEHLKTIKLLEEKVIDLEENLKEKDAVINAKTQAASLISESLSLKGKSTVDMLEDTKQEMMRMQTNFVEAEDDLRAEIERITKECEQKDKKIANLEEVNDILETARFDLTVKNSELDNQSSNVEDYIQKVNELNKVNETLQRRIESLENNQSDPDDAVPDQATVEQAFKIQGLEFAIKELQTENIKLKESLQNVQNQPPPTGDDQSDRIQALETELASKKEELLRHTESLEDVQEQLMEKTVEFNVLVANFNVLQEKLKSSVSKSLFSRPTDEEAHAEIKKLRLQLETLTSSSDTNKTLLEKQDEINSLNERIVQLESDKAAILEASKMELQSRVKDNKSKEEVTSQLESIALEEKVDIGLKEAAALKQHIHQLTAEKNDLKTKLDRYMTDNMDLLNKIEKLSKGSSAESIEIVEGLTAEEKLEMEQFQKGLEMRQQRRMQTSNTEDDDAEFIPTIPVTAILGDSVQPNVLDNNSNIQQLNDSLEKLSDERSELLQKIELFSTERHEVLERMDILKAENSKLLSIIDELRVDKLEIEQSCENLRKDNLNGTKRLREVEEQRQDLLENIKEISDIKTRLQDEINRITFERNVATENRPTGIPNRETYDNGLKNLVAELENYRKAKDKNVKFGISKKIVKEAKHLADLVPQLLEECERGIDSFTSLQAEVEGTRQARDEFERIRLELMAEGCTEDLALYVKSLKEKFETQLKSKRETRDKIEELEQLLDEERREKEDLKRSLDERIPTEEASTDTDTISSSLKDENNRLNEKIRELEEHINDTKEYTFNELHKQRKEYDNRVATSQKEIEILQALIDEQKQQLIAAYTEHEEETQEKVKQITELGLQVQKLRAELENTEQKMSQANDKYVDDLKEKLDSMKSLLDENNSLLNSQAADLANKQETIETLNQQIMDLYAAMEQQGAELNDKDEEINKLQDSVDGNLREIRSLKERSQSYDKRIKDADGKLAEKEKEMLNIQTDLEAKNKEQLEKLKKFAANLKKKNSQYSDLELKYKELEALKDGRSSDGDSCENTKDNTVNEKLLEEQKREIDRLQEEVKILHLETKRESVQLQQSSANAPLHEYEELKNVVTNLENIIQNKDSEILGLQQNIGHSHAELENIKLRLSEKVMLVDQFTSETQAKTAEILELRDTLITFNEVKEQLVETDADLKLKNIKIEKCKAIIKEKNREIKRLNEQVQTLVDQQLPQTESIDNNAELDQLKLEKQTIEKDYECYRSSIDAKLQESALFIETLESENNQLKERIGRLEESICVAEDRRLSLERHAELLGSQLQQKETQIENVEDEYMNRLEAIVGQDEIIEQKLKDLEGERDSLNDNLKELREHSAETLRQNSLLQSQITELETIKLLELESDNKLFTHKIEKLESDLQRQSVDFERTLEKKQAEFADLENELSNHLKEVEKERRAQQEILEKCREENAILQDELERLREFKLQLEQIRADLTSQVSWYQLQTESMNQDQLETQELRMQVVQDQTEVENLRTQNQEMAHDHEAALNGIRQQLADVQAAYDSIFATHQLELAAKDELNAQIATLNAQNQQITQEHQVANNEIAVVKDQLSSELETLKSQICHDQTDLVNLRLQNQQLTSDHEAECTTLRLRISELNSMQIQSEQEHLEVQNLRAQIGSDHAEIENLRAQKQQLDHELSSLRQQITALDSMQMHVGQNITQDQLEVQQLRTQVGHDQTEIETLRTQMQQLQSAHDSELAALRQQIAELDSLRMQVGQNQTDDQVFIQNENERLQAVLAEKELEIQNYQRQNLQLQMLAGSTSAASTVHDPFAALNTNMVSIDGDSTSILTNRITELEHQLETVLHDGADKSARIQHLEATLSASYSTEETTSLELQRQVCEKDVEIARLQDIHQNLLSSLPAEQDHSSIINAAQFGAGCQEHAINNESPIHNINFLEVSSASPPPPPLLDGAYSIPLPLPGHDQQIEDLQRNVSDLEKYATDIENKLKSAIEENLKHANERYLSESNFANKTSHYEERIAILDQQIDELTNELAVLRAERQVVQSEIEVISVNRLTTEPQPMKTASIFFATSNETPDDPFNTVVGSHFGQSSTTETDVVDADGRVPAVEEIIVAKKAYLCHPTEDVERQTMSPLSNQDDAWGESGWGGDEAALEEEHQRLSSTDTQCRGLNTAEVKLQLQIDELTTERSHLQSELNSMQTKYSKMLKKLREYKTKNDEHEHSKRASSIETNDLDLAIQEELNSQIRVLEQRVKEMKQDQKKESIEKKKLHSRIDVLSSANDRMLEMKEKQDIEVEVCKTKIRELSIKLEQLNTWDDDQPSVNNLMQDNSAARLTEALNQNRILEDRITRLQESISEKDEFEEERILLNEKLNDIETERRTLVETVHRNDTELADLRKKIKSLESENLDYSATIDVLTVESTNIKTHLDKLKDEHKQKIDENNNLSENLKSLDDRNLELSKQIEEMRVYNLSVQDVEQRIQDLTATVQYKDSEMANLNEQLDSERTEFDEKYRLLDTEAQANAKLIADLQQQLSELNAVKTNLESIVAQLEAKKLHESSNDTVRDEDLGKVVSELRSENAQMEHELQVLNDQVLKNLQIEDKIKATVLELDLKNIEISELKSSLEQMRDQQQHQHQQKSNLSPSIDESHIDQIHSLQTKLEENESYHQTTIVQLNEQWQQSVEQKCSDLADSWRQHLAEREEGFAQIENDLRQQLAELENRLTTAQQSKLATSSDTDIQQEHQEYQSESNPSTTTSSPKSEQSVNDVQTTPEMMEQMQKALEAQEMEIVSLKEQLAMRSAQYARIAAQIDPYGEWSTLANNARRMDPADDGGSRARARELDHALYMLHQRDMRCEELKMEVINLLGERDGLQKKLIALLREIEDIKQQTGASR